ncbi:VOC family protein [Streptomyces sp. URMC 129]|uniref:VOC family protein n=1 Tax=Streptomyces sp. URMC 129 TaxID=3423407 RepID=UPI003F1B3CE2
MSLVVEQYTLDALDPARLAAFWCAALGWRVVEDDGEEIFIAGEDPRVPGILLIRVPEAKAGKNRAHLDLRPGPGQQDAEVGRLVALGARVVDVGQPAEAPWRVLADPEGNEFCVTRP